ncbi:hypothetical protein [uncultured Paludibaculum sp.]|uniref:FtsB family cell division protein n=1 Tax=uncultured Paludibaculum sp. TaxID=1765020 RepID=UPI002AAC2103|nr:hypothetical protein [uncultured Paludibaculum sp.]
MFSLLRQLGFVAAAAVTCFYVFLVLRGPNGIPAMLEKRHQIERMKQENEQMRQEIERRKVTIDQLEHSSEARDRAVREHTRKAKQHETTIYLNDENDPASPQQ